MFNWKETKCGKCKIQRKRPVCNSCFSYDKFIPIAITNADRIRAMSDEKLAELLADENFKTKVSNEFCRYLCKNRSTEGCLLDLEKDPCPYTEKDDMLLWLQSEVEE